MRTLTVAVYDTWLDRNSLAGAAQIACIMLAFVFAVLATERTLRANRRYHHTTGRYRNLPEATLTASEQCWSMPPLLPFSSRIFTVMERMREAKRSRALATARLAT